MKKFLAVLLTCISALASAQQCERKWKKVGCFHDYVTTRPLLYELLNRRDPYNHNFDGKLINWKAYPATLKELYCRCAELTEQRGYTHFGLQFYGECWSGPNATDRFGIQGVSGRCIGGDYGSCVDSAETECIGKDSTNYIYQLFKENPTDAVINGGYSDWTSWSECSKSCGGGVKTRSRSCTNPSPSATGRDCMHLGESEELTVCNNQACGGVCKKAIDLGFIMDASSSVRRINYNKVKSFIKDLSDEFMIGASATRFGIIHYSNSARLDFTPRDTAYHERTALKAKIDSIVYSYGGTRTDRALRMAETEFFCSGCNPAGKPKVLMVITDGNTNVGSEDLGVATKGMKDNKVTIISLGIGPDIDLSELRLIASEPKEKHVFKLANFDELKAKLDSILVQACATTK